MTLGKMRQTDIDEMCGSWENRKCKIRDKRMKNLRVAAGTVYE